MFKLILAFSCQRRPIIFHLIRSFALRSHVNIENQMKQLSDQHQYVKTLTLFDQFKHQQIPTDRMFVQALNDVFIQSTLIHFYS